MDDMIELLLLLLYKHIVDSSRVHMTLYSKANARLLLLLLLCVVMYVIISTLST